MAEAGCLTIRTEPETSLLANFLLTQPFTQMVTTYLWGINIMLELGKGKRQATKVIWNSGVLCLAVVTQSFGAFVDMVLNEQLELIHRCWCDERRTPDSGCGR